MGRKTHLHQPTETDQQETSPTSAAAYYGYEPSPPDNREFTREEYGRHEYGFDAEEVGKFGYEPTDQSKFLKETYAKYGYETFDDATEQSDVQGAPTGGARRAIQRRSSIGRKDDRRRNSLDHRARRSPYKIKGPMSW